MIISIPSRIRRCVVGYLGLAALVLLSTACAGSATEAPTSPTGQPSPTASPGPETPSAAPQPRECTVTVNARTLDKTGYGSAQIVDGKLSFTCETGPLVSIVRIADNAVTFTSDGVPATITNGSSASVGTYQITVLSITAGTAVFKAVVLS